MNKRFNIRKCNADIYRDNMVLLKGVHAHCALEKMPKGGGEETD